MLIYKEKNSKKNLKILLVESQYSFDSDIMEAFYIAVGFMVDLLFFLCINPMLKCFGFSYKKLIQTTTVFMLSLYNKTSMISIKERFTLQGSFLDFTQFNILERKDLEITSTSFLCCSHVLAISIEVQLTNCLPRKLQREKWP